MTIKPLLLTLITLFLIGCSPNPTNKSFRHQTTPTKTEAILKLDTKGHTALIRDIIVTKSGDIISASDDKTIRVWDSKTGKEKRKILGQIGAGAEGMIYAIALSPNNKFLAIGGMLAGIKNRNIACAIRIYNYKTGKLLKILKSHTGVVADLAFSKDGKYLISGSGDFTAKIWNVKDWNLKDTIKFHTNDIYAVKIIKKEGNYFAITAGDDNRIALYNIQTKKIVKFYKLPYKLEYLAISKDNIAVCGFGKEIKIYDFNLNPIKTIYLETKPSGLAYSSNGKYLIVGRYSTPNNVNIYSVNKNYKKIQSFKKHKSLTMAVAFLNNQIAISGGGNNNEIYIWNIKTAKVLKKIEGVGNIVWSVGIKGNNIAWGNKAKSVRNSYNNQKYINLKTFQIDNLKNQKFNRISTIYKNYSLNHRKGGMLGLPNGILDIKQNNKTIASIIRGSTNGYRHNCYGFYKNYIISGGSNGFLKIYNLQGQEIANLVGHIGEIWSIAIDGDRLVSGSNDQTIRVWDLSKLKMDNGELKIDYNYLKKEQKEAEKQTGKKCSIQDIMNFHDKQGTNYYIIPQMQPQLSLFISKNNNWIAWTPQGFYNASKGAEQYIGYHINQGSDKEAIFLPISSFKDKFYRPDIIAKALNGEDISRYNSLTATQLIQKSGLPPKIKIENQPFATDRDSAKIGISVCERSGGFGKLLVKIDGKIMEYANKTKAFQHRKEKKGVCNIIERSIDIPSGGEHKIEVLATNSDETIFSKSDFIKIKSLKEVVKKPNLHLLTLSISDYQDDSLDLKYPNNDADELTKKIKEIGTKIYSKIYTYNLKDSKVTLKGIREKIAEIAPNIKSNDVFILYISGHGITNEDNGDYYFIPYNCPNNSDETKYGISQKHFKELLSKIKAVKSVILLDTCESGSMASKELLNTSINRLGGGVGTAIIAGATSKQNAIDGYKQHGIFTYTVLDAMSNPKVYSFDDKLSINEVAEYTKYLLPRLAKEKFKHKQEPTIYLNGDTSFPIGGI